MPTMITGTRGSANIQQARRVVDMSKDIALLEPDAAPLTVLLKQMDGKTREAINPEFKWLEDELAPRWDAINNGAGYTAGSTSIVVDNGSYFKAGDIVKVPRTVEQMLVTAVSTNTLTVTRGWGTTAAAGLVDNDPLLILGNSSAEGASSPTTKTTQEAVYTNYTEIIRTPFDVTGTDAASELYGGRDMNYLRKKMGIEHKKSIELAYLFGEKKEDTTGSQPQRFTGGLNYWVSTNRQDAGGALTEAEFEQFCRTIFRYGNSTKVLLASPLLVSGINQWANGKLQMFPKDKTYGISVKEYLTGHGTLLIVKHNLLEQSYSGYGFAVDTEFVAHRPLRGRDTKLRMGIQANDADTEKDEYLTESGLEVKLEKAHGVLYGITSIS